LNLSEMGEQAIRFWLVFYAVGLLFALLARRLGHPGFLPRILVWFVLVPVALGSAYAGAPYFLAVLMCACLVGCFELSRLFPRTGAPTSRAYLGQYVMLLVAALPWMYWVLGNEGLRWQLAPLAAVGSVMLHPGIRRAAESEPQSLSRPDRRLAAPPLTVLGDVVLLFALAVGLGVGLAFWGRILLLPSGFRYVLFAFSVVALNDVTAAVIGSLLGGPRPFPRLSPRKTVSGFVGGAACGMLVAYSLWFAVPELDFIQVTLAGLILVLSGTAGDLFASGVKRRHGIKDFGTFMGPCGGMLDRLDSLLGASPVFFIYLQLVL
jgi:phosphatidate cytidylyltransferase